MSWLGTAAQNVRRTDRSTKSRKARRVRNGRRAISFEALESRHLLSVMFVDTEENDAIGTPQAVTSPGLSAGVVDMITSPSGSVTTGDPDYYSFQAAVPGELNVSVGYTSGTSNATVTFYDNANNPIGAPVIIDTSNPLASTTVPAVNTANVYKVGIVGDDAQYQLRIWNPDREDDGGVHNDTRATATNLGTLGSIPAGDLQNYTITRPDRDYFRFVSNVSGPVEVRAVMPTGTGLPSGPTNLGIRIRDAAGAIIASSNGATADVDVATFTAVNGQTYYGEIYSGSVGQVNRYDLQIQALTGQIQGYKFIDANGNGFFDAGENQPPSAVQNWQIFLDTTPNGTYDAGEPLASTAADGSYSFPNLAAGTYRVREVLSSSYSQTLPGAADNFEYVASINRDNLYLDHIDFGNLPLGSITVIKDAVPNDPQDFEFDPSANLQAANFFLDDDSDGTLPNSRTFGSLLPGTYTVQEVNLPAGWSLTNLVIVDPDNGSSVNLGTGTATIDVDAGESITVTFTDTKSGSITVIKDAVPNDAQDFEFDPSSNLQATNFFLDDDADGTLSNTQLFNGLLPGTYSVQELNIPSGWTLTNVSVTGATSSTYTVAGGLATINLAVGENLTVTYTDTRQGSIRVIKDTVPNDAQDFEFDPSSNLQATNFFLDDDADGTLSNTQLFSGLLPGTYSVQELNIPAGWTLTNVSVTGATSSTYTVAGGLATINLAVGENLTVTYTDTRQGSIRVIKDAVPNDAQDFEFDPSSNLQATNFLLDDDADGTLSNTQLFNGLLPGTYSVQELNIPAGWTLTNVSVTGATSSTYTVAGGLATINLAVGENLTVTYTDTRQGSIRVIKDAVPNDAQDFEFDPSSNLQATNFLLDDDADGTLSNTQLFNGLLPGTYSVQELNIPAGWTLTNVSVTGATSSTYTVAGGLATINLAVGENLTVTYTDTRQGSIRVIKDAVPNDAQDFEFDPSSNLQATNFFLDDDADGTLSNTQLFNGLLPGTYSVQELNIPAGWTLTNVSVTGATSSTYTVAGGLATINLAVGENLTVTYTDTRQGSIRVIKDAVPNDAQDFEFDPSSNLQATNFFLDDDADGTLSNTQLFGGLLPGTYSVQELNIPAGWTLTNVSVTGATSSTYTVAGGLATINLAVGENLTVTYTDTRQGSIRVIKDAVPNDAQDFEFDPSSNLQATNFFLDDDADGTLSNTQLFNGLLPGTYSVQELNIPAGWTLTNVSVTGATSSTYTVAGGLATINLAVGESITVTFTNAVTPAFTGTKFYDLVADGVRDANGVDNIPGNTDDEVGLQGWTIELYRDVDSDGQFEPNGPFGVVGDDGAPVYTAVTDANGNYSLAPLSLPNGRYFIREVVRSGWTQSSSPTYYTFIYAGATIAPVDFGNASCTGTLYVPDGSRVVTAQRDGLLTLALSQGTMTVTRVGVPGVDDGGNGIVDDAEDLEFDAYNGSGGVLSGVTTVSGQRVDILIGANDYLHSGAHPTPPGTQFSVTISGSGGAGTFTVLNAVNVDVAGSLALIITGTECGELIVVDDDKDPDGPDPDTAPDQVGGPSDAKAIYFGTVEGVYNGGANLTSTGIEYNTAIMDAMFGIPTISRVEVYAEAGDDIVRVTDDIVQQSTLDAGPGDDNVRAGAGRAYMSGGDGIDLLVGGTADDIIYGGLSHDRIYGGAGADRAYGDAGDDWIAGGDGDDALLRGGDGNDRISGGSGRDRLYGDAGFDNLYRDAVDYLVDVGLGGGAIASTPPDPAEQYLLDLITKYWNDLNPDAKDTLDELINSILP